MFMTNLLQFVD